jgi:nitroreductase
MADALVPALGLSSAETATVLATATLAPSVHNTQPWAFRTTPELIELHADRARRLPVADPDDTELRLSLGAALFTLRLALGARGIRTAVTLFPDRDRPDLVAQVRHGGPASTAPELRRLLDAVPRRHTNRWPFRDEPVTVPEEHALRRAAAVEEALLHVVHDRVQRAELSRLAGLAHRRQTADPAFRAELARWTGGGPGRPDGVPLRVAGPAPAPQDRWVLRDFAAGAAHERAPGADFEDEPLVAVLVPHRVGPGAEVRAGEALQRVLLTATADGLAVSFLSQLIEVPEAREELRRVIGAVRPPLAVLRVGHGWPTPRTPRRPVPVRREETPAP